MSNLLEELEELLTPDKQCYCAHPRRRTRRTLLCSSLMLFSWSAWDSMLPNLRAPWQRVGLLCVPSAASICICKMATVVEEFWAYLPFAYLPSQVPEMQI